MGYWNPEGIDLADLCGREHECATDSDKIISGTNDRFVTVTQRSKKCAKQIVGLQWLKRGIKRRNRLTMARSSNHHGSDDGS